MELVCPGCGGRMMFDGEYGVEEHLPTTPAVLHQTTVWRFLCPTRGCYREALVQARAGTREPRSDRLAAGWSRRARQDPHGGA